MEWVESENNVFELVDGYCCLASLSPSLDNTGYFLKLLDFRGTYTINTNDAVFAKQHSIETLKSKYSAQIKHYQEYSAQIKHYQKMLDKLKGIT